MAGVINGPEKLGKGAIIQIRTDKRSFTFTIGNGCEVSKYFLKYPDEKTAVLELEPPKDPGESERLFLDVRRG